MVFPIFKLRNLNARYSNGKCSYGFRYVKCNSYLLIKETVATVFQRLLLKFHSTERTLKDFVFLKQKSSVGTNRSHFLTAVETILLYVDVD